jgi:predicted dienelactone hydrolase
MWLPVLLCVLLALSGKGEVYDPSVTRGEVKTRLTSFAYQERTVPLKVYLPASGKKAPVVLLSHGLGGSRETGVYLASHWAARGYVVVAMQHVGSDESLWKDVPAARRLPALKAGASALTFRDRARDVPATIDQLEKWSVESGHFLEG